MMTLNVYIRAGKLLEFYTQAIHIGKSGNGWFRKL